MFVVVSVHRYRTLPVTTYSELQKSETGPQKTITHFESSDKVVVWMLALALLQSFIEKSSHNLLIIISLVIPHSALLLRYQVHNYDTSLSSVPVVHWFSLLPADRDWTEMTDIFLYMTIHIFNKSYIFHAVKFQEWQQY